MGLNREKFCLFNWFYSVCDDWGGCCWPANKIDECSEYATILFQLKVRAARPNRFQVAKQKLTTVREIETSFRKYDVNGVGRLTKADMRRANEFTLQEVGAEAEAGDKAFCLPSLTQNKTSMSHLLDRGNFWNGWREWRRRNRFARVCWWVK